MCNNITAWLIPRSHILIKLFKLIYRFFRGPEIKVRIQTLTTPTHEVYDPSKDGLRIAKGEIESYFE
jgi:hypothetical protein